MKIFIFTLLCCCALEVAAQRPSSPFDLPDPAAPPSRSNSGYYNMEKYWWYRYNLTKDLINSDTLKTIN